MFDFITSIISIFTIVALITVIFRLYKQLAKKEQMIKSLELTLEAYEERFKER